MIAKVRQFPRNFWNVAKIALRGLPFLRKQPSSIKCPKCALDLTRSEIYERIRVCERCGYHFSIDARRAIALITNAKSFDEFNAKLATLESKTVSAEKAYPKLLKEARRETRLQEAVVTGCAVIGDRRVVLVVFDFRFMGGSMGAAAGEKITLAFERAAEENLPVVVITATGGARIQEGMFALMQMAKTAAAARRLDQKGLPYLAVLSHPTTGGVYASFANLADIILAEPGALIGFAGPRVVEALLQQKLPPESHRAEFLFEHGMVDAIVPRAELPTQLARILAHTSRGDAGANLAVAQRVETNPDPTDSKSAAWKIVHLARRADRPTTRDYVARLFHDFCELHGDRLFGDDPAIIGGLASFEGQSVVVIGQERGHGDDAERRHHGRAGPEGYRKALRLMRLAEKFRLPVITLVDTPGADPSYESEKRGVAMALAQSIGAMTQLATQTIAVVIGEGGSGGALALAVADRVLMQENAIYSVISPEGASAILYGDASRAQEVSNSLRLTARDLKALSIIDDIVPEPSCGAHVDTDAAAQNIRAHLVRALDELRASTIPALLQARYQKYRQIGRSRFAESLSR